MPHAYYGLVIVLLALGTLLGTIGDSFSRPMMQAGAVIMGIGFALATPLVISVPAQNQPLYIMFVVSASAVCFMAASVWIPALKGRTPNFATVRRS